MNNAGLGRIGLRWVESRPGWVRLGFGLHSTRLHSASPLGIGPVVRGLRGGLLGWVVRWPAQAGLRACEQAQPCARKCATALAKLSDEGGGEG